MPYTAEAPTRRESNEELRARIPGWGADLDPADRPAVPRERFAPEVTGAHWDFPERQEERVPRERSIEHRFLTPVFGTSAPLHGVSGAIRRFAYEKFGEGRAAHWLLLIAGDRVDAVGSHLRSVLTLRPDNPVTETGVVSELRRGGIRSRVGRGRADVKHGWIDPLLIAGFWVFTGIVAVAVVRSIGKR
ncbi:hypothetical protein OH146_00290 [Salinibacterium sp. SYSU T00001]|uniref:hypothetical protein n=1 Tax=Homoserinimonas sedimenticola TaxID=2986805 RepID=UPI002235C61E|nr:hypothetical protein [Salinibacterium sedimenticola]MCW4384209.1 hypothetical protein [Salinibacterium sedimenticola]